MKLPRLKEVRELHGWSQKRLAEESGVSRDSISNYETGQREAWPATAKRLAEALGVEIADLRGVAAGPKAGAPSNSGPRRTAAPQITHEALGEHDIPASNGEIAEVNKLLEDFWHQVELGEKPRAYFVPEEVDTARVFLLLDYVLTHPDLIGVAPEKAERVRELVRIG